MKIIKQLYLAIAIMAMIMACSTTHAEIFVHDDGTQLTVSWPDDPKAFYYDVVLANLTENTSTIEGPVFGPSIVIDGLNYHNIYGIMVRAWNADGEELESVGQKYITFALEQTSGNCVCICPELVVPKKVFYGLVSDIWWTGIAISNAGDTSQSVVLKIGTIDKMVTVPSHTVEAFLLRDLIGDTTPKSYPIAYETESADVGVTVLISDSLNICAQN